MGNTTLLNSGSMLAPSREAEWQQPEAAKVVPIEGSALTTAEMQNPRCCEVSCLTMLLVRVALSHC